MQADISDRSIHPDSCECLTCSSQFHFQDAQSFVDHYETDTSSTTTGSCADEDEDLATAETPTTISSLRTDENNTADQAPPSPASTSTSTATPHREAYADYYMNLDDNDSVYNPASDIGDTELEPIFHIKDSVALKPLQDDLDDAHEEWPINRFEVVEMFYVTSDKNDSEPTNGQKQGWWSWLIGRSRADSLARNKHEDAALDTGLGSGWCYRVKAVDQTTASCMPDMMWFREERLIFVVEDTAESDDESQSEDNS